MQFNQKSLDDLISCPKRITKFPRDWEYHRGHYRISMELESLDKDYLFSVYGRYNATFLENFSFGLSLLQPKLLLLRFNGKHGEHKSFPHHNHCHIHKATVETLNKGLSENSSIEIIKEECNSYNEGFQFFLKYIKLIESDLDTLFPRQLNLFNQL